MIRTSRSLLLSLAALSVAAASGTAVAAPAVATPPRSAAAAPQPAMLSAPLPSTVDVQPARLLRAGQGAAPETTGPATITTVTTDSTATATFQVTYTGFTQEARADFQRAVDTWSHLVRSSVPIVVSARFAPLPELVMGQAGGTSSEADFPRAPLPHTFYPVALANKLAGTRLHDGPDIDATFNSTDPALHFGASPVPSDKIDFSTVVLHELGHGLGFVGEADVVDGRGSMTTTPGYALVFDRFTRTGDGRPLLGITDPGQLASALQSGDVRFDSPSVRSAGGGAPAELYAPDPWGISSYSHLDEAAYPEGSPDALMSPTLGYGERIRTPGPVTLAVFRTLGW
jgi:hypothetical protein